MAEKSNYLPEGFHCVSPILVIRNAAEAIGFYQKAFGAEMQMQMDRPDGKIMHASLKIGDSNIMLGEECAPHEGHKDCVRSPDDLQGTTFSLYLYVTDADAIFHQAVQAGASEIMPVNDTFWGDRMGMVRDPYGHVWAIAAHTEDLSEEQIEQKKQEFLASKQ